MIKNTQHDMKTLLTIIFSLVFSLSYAQINWMTVEQAITAQKKNPKKIIIDFYSENNKSCSAMDQHTYAHPEIIKLITDKYYAVKFNALGNNTVNFYDRVFKNPDFVENSKDKNNMHSFAKFMNVNSCPSLVFLDEKGQVITNLNGLFSAKELEPYLSMIGGGDYKNIKTREQWESYQKKFKSKIKQ